MKTKVDGLNQTMKYYFPLILIFLSCNQNTRFDSVKWKNAGGESIVLDKRLNMVNDLIESEVLLYKNEIEIIELLGSPSRLNGQGQESIKLFPVQEIYGLDIDPKEMFFLKIKFDENGESILVEKFSTK